MPSMNLPTGAVCFEGLKRRRGCFGQRSGVLLYTRKRFANAGPELGGHCTERFQHVLFPMRLLLFSIEHAGCAAILRSQTEHILRAEHGNGALYRRNSAGPLTDLSRYLPA